MGQITKNPDLNIFTGGLNMDDKERIVRDYTKGYNAFPWLAELMKAKPKKAINRPDERIKGWYGKYWKAIMGNDCIVGQIASTALTANSTLTITWTDNTLDIFRVGDVVTDGTLVQNMGKVVSASSGSVVLEPTPATGGAAITFDTTTMFLAGAFVSVLFDAHGLGNSEPKSNLMQTPNYIPYQTSVSRDNLAIQNFLDTGMTWMDAPVKNIKGTNLWYYAYEMQLAARIAKQEDLKAWGSKQGTITNSLTPGGMINYSRGCRDSVMANDGSGGIYRPQSSAMTQSALEELMFSTADRRANIGTKLSGICGRGFLRQVQNFTAPFVQYAGINNTFGGRDVKGIDVHQFSVGGVQLELTEVAFMNDRNQFPTMSTTNPGFTRMSNTCLLINMDATPRAYGTGESLPSIERIYYGMPEPDCIYIKPGVISGAFKNTGYTMEGFETAMSIYGKAGLAVTEIPQDSIGWITNSCYSFDTFDWGLWEQL